MQPTTRRSFVFTFNFILRFFVFCVSLYFAFLCVLRFFVFCGSLCCVSLCFTYLCVLRFTSIYTQPIYLLRCIFCYAHIFVCILCHGDPALEIYYMAHLLACLSYVIRAYLLAYLFYFRRTLLQSASSGYTIGSLSVTQLFTSVIGIPISLYNFGTSSFHRFPGLPLGRFPTGRITSALIWGAVCDILLT